jgi:pimeloyl-ACP methyl ester carboxylesterase
MAKAEREQGLGRRETSYRTVEIDKLRIFYRDAGPKDRPVILLLKGLRSSSRMFDPLFARLSHRYHLVAPDYPSSAFRVTHSTSRIMAGRWDFAWLWLIRSGSHECGFVSEVASVDAGEAAAAAGAPGQTRSIV